MRPIVTFLVAVVLLLWNERPVVAGPLFAIDNDTGNLYQVSTSNASLALVGNTGLVGFGGIEFAPNGTLYGVTSSFQPTPSLYTINPLTAAATLKGPLGIGFVFEGALAFAPDGTAYGANGGDAGNDKLFKINLSTGAATVLGTLAGSHDIDGLAVRSDGMLIGLDRVTNSLLVIDPVSLAISTLATLVPTVGGVGGMTADGSTGFFSTSGPGGSNPGSDSLYSFNLFTGSSALIGTFPGAIQGNGISGLAATPAVAPQPATGILVALGGLGLLTYRCRRRAPLRHQ
jgi:hypothetical protein